VHGQSKYGISRTIRVVLDLLTVKFLLSYSTRPLQIFGLVGLALSIPGLLIMAYLTFVKFAMSEAIGNRPLLMFGVLLVFTGVQLLTLGLMAELLVRTYHESQDKPTYVIREIRESPALAAPARESHRAGSDGCPPGRGALPRGQATAGHGLGGPARHVGRRRRGRDRRDAAGLRPPWIDAARATNILAPSARRVPADRRQPR